MSNTPAAVAVRSCTARPFTRHLIVLSCLAAGGAAWAQATSPEGALTLPPANVTGYAEPVQKSALSSDPAANPASVTVLELSDDRRRNTRDYVDLLKPVMGVAANNFDQGGIGFGFTMRGFSERSNGGGVAYSIDGVPVNLPSHPLTNGYGDLTPLIPELIDRLVLTRGPFDVRFGANALGGSAQITTQDAPTPGAALSVGNFDYARGFANHPIGFGAATGYASLLAANTEGYRENAELRQINTFNKLLFPMPEGTGSLRLQIFSDTFGAPGFVRRDLVESGQLGKRTAINSTDGGNTDLQVLAFNYKQRGEQPLNANVYVMHTVLDRFSNRQATIPIDEGLPGQALQTDDRLTFGGTAEKYFRWAAAEGTGTDVFFGGGLRMDIAESEIFNTIRRVNGARTEDSDFRILNPYAYAQANYKPIASLKLTAGLRYDHLYFDIDDQVRNISVSPDLGIVQPKAGIVYTPLRGLDLFANYGRSFLPPSATGGQLSRNPDLDAPRLATRELGAQYRSADGSWSVLADIYRTTFTNEIFNRPPPALPDYLGPSKRDGYDVEGRLRAYNNAGRVLWLFLNYSEVDGELVDRPGGTSIPDVAEYFIKYGFDLAWPLAGSAHAFTWSASQVWEGPKPLNTANTLATRRFSRVDSKLTYTNRDWKGFSAFFGLILYPDRRLEETAFTFGTPATIGVSPKARVTTQAGVFIPF